MLAASRRSSCAASSSTATVSRLPVSCEAARGPSTGNNRSALTHASATEAGEWPRSFAISFSVLSHRRRRRAGAHVSPRGVGLAVSTPRSPANVARLSRARVFERDASSWGHRRTGRGTGDDCGLLLGRELDHFSRLRPARAPRVERQHGLDRGNRRAPSERVAREFGDERHSAAHRRGRWFAGLAPPRRSALVSLERLARPRFRRDFRGAFARRRSRRIASCGLFSIRSERRDGRIGRSITSRTISRSVARFLLHRARGRFVRCSGDPRSQHRSALADLGGPSPPTRRTKIAFARREPAFRRTW